MALTVAEGVELLVTALRAEGAKPATVTWYRHRLRLFCELYGHWDATEITLDEVRAYMVQVQESKYAPHTRFTLVRVVRRLFKWLYEERKIDGNFHRRIKVPRLPQQAPKGIEMQDVVAILDACPATPTGWRDRAIILFLLDTGCRVGGLCGLQVQDLDLDRMRARMLEKGDKDRLALFGSRTAAALKRWLEARPFPEVENVFTSMRHPRGVCPNTVIQMLRRYGRRAGVRGRVNPHAFRHAFAREYILNGGDLASVSEILGHTQIAVTKQHYALFLAEELREKHGRFSPVSRLEIPAAKGEDGPVTCVD